MVKITHEKAVKRGKKNKKSGNDFELKVRKNLLSEGWIVAKWTNNVKFDFCKCKDNISNSINECRFCKKQFEYGATRLEAGKLVPAKHKFNPFNKVMTIGTGFPDFIAFKNVDLRNFGTNFEVKEVIGVEAKSNGYLTPEEIEKCKWLLDNSIFSRIIIAKKGEKRKIIYTNFVNKK